jgi:hypothetical protein
MLTIIRPSELNEGGLKNIRAPEMPTPAPNPSASTHHFSFNRFPYRLRRA